MGVVLASLGPCVAGHQNLFGNSGAGIGDLKSEHGHLGGGDVVELAAVDSVDDSAGVLERATRTNSVSSSSPSSVDEPGGSAVLL